MEYLDRNRTFELNMIDGREMKDSWGEVMAVAGYVRVFFGGKGEMEGCGDGGKRYSPVWRLWTSNVAGTVC